MTEEHAALLLPAIIRLLRLYESRLADGVIRDNQRCEGLRLELYPDLSGRVLGEYTPMRKDDTDAERVLSVVMRSEWEPLFTFHTLEECHGELVALTMRISG